jgi:hypothetical protein
MKKQSLFGILSTITLATIMSIGVSLKIMQSNVRETQASTTHYARDVFQMNRIRYDGGWSNGISHDIKKLGGKQIFGICLMDELS